MELSLVTFVSLQITGWETLVSGWKYMALRVSKVSCNNNNKNNDGKKKKKKLINVFLYKIGGRNTFKPTVGKSAVRGVC